MTKKLPLIILCCIIANWASAQASYSLQVSNSTYTALTAPTPISNGMLWDDDEFPVPLGFNFTFYDEVLDTIFIGDLGAILYSKAPSVTALSDTVSMFAVFGDDLFDRAGFAGVPPALSPISYLLTGSAPNRIGKLEYKNAGYYDDNSGDMFINFQVWFYETTNVMEIHYGTHDVTDSTIAYTSGVGPTIFLMDKFVQADDAAYGLSYGLSGAQAAPLLTPLIISSSTIFPFLTATPSNGKVYIFIPGQTTGVNGSNPVANFQVRTAPNPVTDVLNIQYASTQSASAMLTDMMGKLIWQKEIRGNESVDLRSAAPGIYLLKLTAPGEGTYTEKIIKQ